jgi:hypothetical protein
MRCCPANFAKTCETQFAKLAKLNKLCEQFDPINDFAACPTICQLTESGQSAERSEKKKTRRSPAKRVSRKQTEGVSEEGEQRKENKGNSGALFLFFCYSSESLRKSC